uniref:Uncharacterized protein n=1 Tax=Mustela putorius furo TaxID=9669 RepID=M3YK91_MUSPF
RSPSERNRDSHSEQSQQNQFERGQYSSCGKTYLRVLEVRGHSPTEGRQHRSSERSHRSFTDRTYC